MNKLMTLNKKQFNNYISSVDIYNEILYNRNIADKNREMLENALEILQQYREHFQILENKKTYRESKNEINATLQMLFKKLKSKITDLEEEFDDIHYRIYIFGLIQKLLNEIIDNLNESDSNQKYLMRMSIIIHDLIKKVKSENLTAEHLKIVQEGLLIIVSGKATREDVMNLDNNLLDSGIDWICG